MLKMNERFICCMLAAILLFMGMCLDTTETDSSFLYANAERTGEALSSVEYIFESADSCTAEMIGKKGSMSSIRGELSRNIMRWDRSILLSIIVGAILQYLLYFYSTVGGRYREILRSSTVAINYIHHKDGEK